MQTAWGKGAPSYVEFRGSDDASHDLLSDYTARSGKNRTEADPPDELVNGARHASVGVADWPPVRYVLLYGLVPALWRMPTTWASVGPSEIEVWAYPCPPDQIPSPPPLPPALPPFGASPCSCTSGHGSFTPRATCSVTGDPHYWNWYGEKFNFFGRGLYEQARFTIESCGCQVIVQSLHAKITGGKVRLRNNAGIAATALRVGNSTFVITGNGTLTITTPEHNEVLLAESRSRSEWRLD